MIDVKQLLAKKTHRDSFDLVTFFAPAAQRGRRFTRLCTVF
jgi:hypothetical protein